MNAAILQTPSDAKLLSPGLAIRAFCRECLSDNAAEIRRCTARQPEQGKVNTGSCWLWAYRHGAGCDTSRDPRPPSRLTCIKRECLQCQGNLADFVRTCQSTDCALWVFRLGHNPHRAGIGNLRASFKPRETRPATGPDSEPTEAPVPVERELTCP